MPPDRSGHPIGARERRNKGPIGVYRGTGSADRPTGQNIFRRRALCILCRGGEMNHIASSCAGRFRFQGNFLYRICNHSNACFTARGPCCGNQGRVPRRQGRHHARFVHFCNRWRFRTPLNRHIGARVSIRRPRSCQKHRCAARNKRLRYGRNFDFRHRRSHHSYVGESRLSRHYSANGHFTWLVEHYDTFAIGARQIERCSEPNHGLHR